MNARKIKTRYVFITGGVVSSLGKGLSSAALGALLQARGYTVRLRKFDPYINVDPGTMSPYQHGEVYVTDDGAETDLDLGHYERFTGVVSRQSDNYTSGRIYQEVIAKERRGDYLGNTVQVIPHVTNAIKTAIRKDTKESEYVLVEIGGTVGDIESLPFLEAIRQFGIDEGKENVAYIHLTLMPYIQTSGEQKTKPTQHSVKELRSIGIQPDILICRCDRPIQESEKEKIALFCNVKKERVIQALDASTIYEVPIAYYREGLDDQLLKHFNISKPNVPNLKSWKKVVKSINSPDGSVNITIVGKYIGLKDSYKSLIEALCHGGIANGVEVCIEWVDSDTLLKKSSLELLSKSHAILIPGGFGERGISGKILAANYARKYQIPFLGICLGLQIAIIEVMKNVVGYKDSGSSEFGAYKHLVVGLLKEWDNKGKKEIRSNTDVKGGTMRLGSYECVLEKGSKAFDIYKNKIIQERHRHRYEVNINYEKVLRKVGVIFSGKSPDGLLPEIIEIENHPWFIGVQFHPELKSSPLQPHPIFASFIKAALRQSRLV